jgi:transcription termination factor NusB
MAKGVPWDGQTDGFITDIDGVVSKKYGVSLRNLLLHSSRYANKKDIASTVKNIKKEVSDYFDVMLSGLKEEQEKLDSELEEASSQYKQVDALIASKAAVARVPYVKPLYVDRNTANDETVIVDKYDTSFDGLIGKFVFGSHYIADMSATYKQHTLGSWLFSGQKNYVLTLTPPTSPVLAINNSIDTINGMLDDVLAELG